MRKSLIVLLAMLFIMSGCGKEKENQVMSSAVNEEPSEHEEYLYNLTVKVVEVHETYMLVSPIQSGDVKITDSISVDLKCISDGSVPDVGNLYEIIYDGNILETYPAQLQEIYDMKRVENTPSGVVTNTITYQDGEAHELYDADIQAIMSLLDSYTWNEGTGDCLNDYMFTINELRYGYHSDCGTINDITHSRSVVVNENDRVYLNELLKQFVQERVWNGTMKVECY